MNFKKWLTTEYSHNQLADMANHGCQGGISGLIYYYDLRKVYAEFAEDIHIIIGEYCDETGEKFPEFIAEKLGEYSEFVGRCVWFAAEWVAHEVTQGEYVDDDGASSEDQDDGEEYPTDESRSYGPRFASR